MGAWGEGPFDNDDAADWMWRLEQSSDLRLVRQILEDVRDGTGQLDAGEGAVAVAAAEIVAMSLGRTSITPSSAAAAWVRKYGGDAHSSDATLALAAMDRVEGTESELAELWDDAGTEWRNAMDGLRERLS